jgi:hypothetical protein
VAVEVGAGSVVAHGGAGVGVAGGDLYITKINTGVKHRGDECYLLSILKSSWSGAVSRGEAGKACEAREWPAEIQAGREQRLAIQSSSGGTNSSPQRAVCRLPARSAVGRRLVPDKVRILVRQVPDGLRNACPSQRSGRGDNKGMPEHMSDVPHVSVGLSAEFRGLGVAGGGQVEEVEDL